MFLSTRRVPQRQAFPLSHLQQGQGMPSNFGPPAGFGGHPADFGGGKMAGQGIAAPSIPQMPGMINPQMTAGFGGGAQPGIMQPGGFTGHPAGISGGRGGASGYHGNVASGGAVQFGAPQGGFGSAPTRLPPITIKGGGVAGHPAGISGGKGAGQGFGGLPPITSAQGLGQPMQQGGHPADIGGGRVAGQGFQTSGGLSLPSSSFGPDGQPHPAIVRNEQAAALGQQLGLPAGQLAPNSAGAQGPFGTGQVGIQVPGQATNRPENQYLEGANGVRNLPGSAGSLAQPSSALPLAQAPPAQSSAARPLTSTERAQQAQQRVNQPLQFDRGANLTAGGLVQPGAMASTRRAAASAPAVASVADRVSVPVQRQVNEGFGRPSPSRFNRGPQQATVTANPGVSAHDASGTSGLTNALAIANQIRQNQANSGNRLSFQSQLGGNQGAELGQRLNIGNFGGGGQAGGVIGGGGRLSQSFQDAINAANQANIDRLNQISGGYGDLIRDTQTQQGANTEAVVGGYSDLGNRAAGLNTSNLLNLMSQFGGERGRLLGDAGDRGVGLDQEFRNLNSQSQILNNLMGNRLIGGYDDRNAGLLANRSGDQGDLESGFGARLQGGLELLRGLGLGTRNRINTTADERIEQQQAGADQDLINRGLGNTTVRSSTMSGIGDRINRSRDLALGDLDDQLRAQSLGTFSNLSGDLLNAVGSGRERNNLAGERLSGAGLSALERLQDRGFSANMNVLLNGIGARERTNQGLLNADMNLTLPLLTALERGQNQGFGAQMNLGGAGLAALERGLGQGTSYLDRQGTDFLRFLERPNFNGPDLGQLLQMAQNYGLSGAGTGFNQGGFGPVFQNPASLGYQLPQAPRGGGGGPGFPIPQGGGQNPYLPQQQQQPPQQTQRPRPSHEQFAQQAAAAATQAVRDAAAAGVGLGGPPASQNPWAGGPGTAVPIGGNIGLDPGVGVGQTAGNVNPVDPTVNPPVAGNPPSPQGQDVGQMRVVLKGMNWPVELMNDQEVRNVYAQQLAGG